VLIPTTNTTPTAGGGIYDSDIKTKAGATSLTWDPNNAHLTVGLSANKFYYNWDGRLKDANE